MGLYPSQTTRTRLIAALFTLILAALLAGCGDESAQGASADPPAANPPANSGEKPLPCAGQATPTNISPEGEPLAATVNGVPITVAGWSERDRRMLGLTVEPATLDAFTASVLDSLIDQVLISLAAEQSRIVVTDAEIDNGRIRRNWPRRTADARADRGGAALHDGRVS